MGNDNKDIYFSKIFFLLVILHAIIIFGCKEKVKSGEVELKRQTVSGVTVREVVSSEVEEYYETTGTVKSKHISIITSKIMGTVTSISVKEGDLARKGDVLITIDDSDSIQRLRASQKALEAARQNKILAEITYQRYKKLYEEKALSGQELDQIETQKKVAELEYERIEAINKEAQVYHSYSRIISPIDGIVTSKKIDTGSMAIVGNPLLIVEDTSTYQVECAVDESLLGKINIGTNVILNFQSTGTELRSKVTEVVPSVDQMTRTFVAKITFKGLSSKTGQFVRVKFPIGKKEALLIPENSVVIKGQLTGVYTVDSSGLITYRLIKLGSKQGNMIEVISGLKSGDKIVVDALDKVIDGGILAEAKTK
ncbi:MAG TPA: efflux RND transporter periplasmic adaptor subunit [Nitrospirae bacterium]|nr:efflux RND transporter periplasmic adaptor subunit [Nitrospirota bacterium]